MNEITKSILEAMAKLGAEKLKEVKSAEEMQTLLAEQGVKVTMEDIQAALEEAQASGKAELSEDALEQVAGGIGWGALLTAIPYVKDVIDLFFGKKGGSTNNTQNNNNNRANQQNAINGNNSMKGGMEVSADDD